MPRRHTVGLLSFAFCWGLLLSSLGVALASALDSTGSAASGLAGPTETFSATSTGLVGAQPPTIDAVGRLLAQHRAALVGFAEGDGAPVAAVFDFGHRVPWFPGVSTPNALAIKGSYSARRWATAHAAPLLPEGLKIVGTVSVPVGTNAQFVVSMEHMMPEGTYVVSGLGPAQRTELFRLLRAGGLDVEPVMGASRWSSAKSSSAVVVAAALVVLGAAAGATWLAAVTTSRRRGLIIDRAFGASRSRLIRDEAWRGVRLLLVGQAVGSLVALPLVSPGGVRYHDRWATYAALTSSAGAVLIVVVFCVVVAGSVATTRGRAGPGA